MIKCKVLGNHVEFYDVSAVEACVKMDLALLPCRTQSGIVWSGTYLGMTGSSGLNTRQSTRSPCSARCLLLVMCSRELWRSIRNRMQRLLLHGKILVNSCGEQLRSLSGCLGILDLELQQKMHLLTSGHVLL